MAASVFAAAVLAVLVVGLLDHNLTSRKVIGKVGPSSGVEYRDGFSYHAGAIEERSWVFGRHRRYGFMLARDEGLDYGHWITFEPLDAGPPRIVAADWRKDGVRLRLESGYEVFAPAESFLGGR